MKLTKYSEKSRQAGSMCKTVIEDGIWKSQCSPSISAMQWESSKQRVQWCRNLSPIV